MNAIVWRGGARYYVNNEIYKKLQGPTLNHRLYVYHTSVPTTTICDLCVYTTACTSTKVCRSHIELTIIYYILLLTVGDIFRIEMILRNIYSIPLQISRTGWGEKVGLGWVQDFCPRTPPRRLRISKN